MKLLLVNPNFTGVVSTPSLGLGFIGTYIKEHSDCAVEIVEPILEGLSEQELLDKAKKSDIVGLVCYTESRFQCFTFAYKVKQINPDCRVIVGGAHVNTLDRQILQQYLSIDGAIRMEGEQTTLEIIKGRPFAQISGLTWRNDGEIIRNPDRAMMEDIDRVNYDYSLVFSQVETWKDVEIPQELQKLKALPIIASRGCPFQCTFCAAHKQWGNTYRGLTPEELVARMSQLANKYNIGYFRFYDALFIGSEERILKFCDLLEKAALDVHFRIDIRVGTNSRVLERLRKVGCDVVGFGVESGSDRVLKRINKGITRKKVEQTIKACKELGYWVIGFFMIALPEETMEDVQRTAELFKFFDRLNVQFFKIHPNTSFYDELTHRGEINDGIWFNPDYGVNTEYGNEIYYCKETFPSANFYFDEASLLIERSIYKYHLANPYALIQSSRLGKGILVIVLSALMNTLLKCKAANQLYRKLRKTFVYKFLKQACRRLQK